MHIHYLCHRSVALVMRLGDWILDPPAGGQAVSCLGLTLPSWVRCIPSQTQQFCYWVWPRGSRTQDHANLPSTNALYTLSDPQLRSVLKFNFKRHNRVQIRPCMVRLSCSRLWEAQAAALGPCLSSQWWPGGRRRPGAGEAKASLHTWSARSWCV